MNERTHFFIEICLSHLILERVMFLVCERWVGDGDKLLHIDFFRILAGVLNRRLLRTKAPCLELVLTPLASYLQLIQAVCVLVIFLFDFHLLPLIYTGASLDWLLGGGQYVIVDHASAFKKREPQKFVSGFALSGLLGSWRVSMLPLETLSLGLLVIAVDPAFIIWHFFQV